MAKRALPPFDSPETFVCYVLETYHEALHFYALKLCRRFRLAPTFADDLMQEFYLSIFENYEKASKGYTLRKAGYFYPIIKYDLLDMNRKHKSLERLEVLASSMRPETNGIYCYASPIVYDAIIRQMRAVLPATDFAIMKLHLDGHTYAEIGAIIDMNESTVGVRIHRARKKLIAHIYS